jgi:hypothetical protein
MSSLHEWSLSLTKRVAELAEAGFDISSYAGLLTHRQQSGSLSLPKRALSPPKCASSAHAILAA